LLNFNAISIDFWWYFTCYFSLMTQKSIFYHLIGQTTPWKLFEVIVKRNRFWLACKYHNWTAFLKVFISWFRTLSPLDRVGPPKLQAIQPGSTLKQHKSFQTPPPAPFCQKTNLLFWKNPALSLGMTVLATKSKVIRYDAEIATDGSKSFFSAEATYQLTWKFLCMGL